MSLSRRTFLRGAGIALSLPLLDAMVPAFRRTASATEIASNPPRRMIAIQTNMGILSQHFFPTATGADFELTAKPLPEHAAAHGPPHRQVCHQHWHDAWIGLRVTRRAGLVPPIGAATHSTRI